MRINWINIFGLMLFVLMIYLFVKLKPVLENIFEHASYSYHSHEYLLIAIVIGFLSLTIVAVVKILSRR